MIHDLLLLTHFPRYKQQLPAACFLWFGILLKIDKLCKASKPRSKAHETCWKHWKTRTTSILVWIGFWWRRAKVWGNETKNAECKARLMTMSAKFHRHFQVSCGTRLLLKFYPNLQFQGSKCTFSNAQAHFAPWRGFHSVLCSISEISTKFHQLGSKSPPYA